MAHQTPRFFTRNELRDVFRLGGTESCDTHQLLEDMLQSKLRIETMKAETEPFEPHLSWVKKLDEVFDFTHNDLVIQVAPTVSPNANKINERSDHFEPTPQSKAMRRFGDDTSSDSDDPALPAKSRTELTRESTSKSRTRGSARYAGNFTITTN